MARHSWRTVFSAPPEHRTLRFILRLRMFAIALRAMTLVFLLDRAGGLVVAAGPAAAGTSESSKAAAEKPAKPAKVEAKAIPKALKEYWELVGCRVSTTGLQQPEEADLVKQLKEVPKLKKQLLVAERELRTLEADDERFSHAMAAGRSRHVELSTRLAGVTDVLVNNQLVGAMRAIEGEIKLAEEQQTKLKTRIKESRQKAITQRELFIEAIVDMRKLVVTIETKWAALAADEKAKSAAEELAAVLGKPVPLAAAGAFISAKKQVAALEDSMVTDAIPLIDKEGNNSLWVSVMLNGEFARDMVVDSGATSISLPAAFAKEIGIEVSESDELVRVSLADGRVIPARRTRLKSVRVGKFEVEDVDCIVLSEEAAFAPPLLGMSFLGQFKFEVNTQAAELRMVKLDAGEQKPTRTDKPKKKK